MITSPLHTTARSRRLARSARLAKRPEGDKVNTLACPAGRRASQLLVTCLIDRFFPDTGDAVVAVLERLGVAVEFPDAQTCCGQPAFNAGYADEARALARHTIDVLSVSDAPVVVPSGSCGDMVIHQYAALFANDPMYAAQATALAARTFEFTQFLVDVLGVDATSAPWPRARWPITPAVTACAASASTASRRRCSPASAASTRCPLDEADVCCGFGGLFAVKMADISARDAGAQARSHRGHRAPTRSSSPTSAAPCT